MPSVEILYARFDEELSISEQERLLSFLPQSLKAPIVRCRSKMEKKARLFGKLLLREGFAKYSSSVNVLESLKFNKYGRPYYEGKIDFNISHSDGCVVCALSDDVRLGIDIEKVRDIDLHLFEKYMTTGEWRNIHSSSNQLVEFYRYWTRKESIMKADGRGMSAPLQDININDLTGELDAKLWLLNEVKIDLDYICTLAADAGELDQNIREIEFNRK